MSSKKETIKRIVRLGYVNFWRNRWLTLGATLLMTLTLTMISVSLLMTFLLRDTAATIRSKIDLTIYFRDDAIADNDIQALGTRIEASDSVTAVHFVTKADALQIWNRLPINENIKKPVTLTNNPLPRSLEIETVNPSTIPAVVTEVQAADTSNLICAECVSYTQNKDTVNRLVSVTRFVQLGGLFLSLFFGVIAIFNVLNIIKITITARSDEIEIMRYVGASNAFIQWPFVIEGIIYGLLATLLTTFFLVTVAWLASRSVQGSTSGLAFLQFINIDLFHYLIDHIWVLVFSQLAIGMLLGIAVSLFSLRRYLRA